MWENLFHFVDFALDYNFAPTIIVLIMLLIHGKSQRPTEFESKRSGGRVLVTGRSVGEASTLRYARIFQLTVEIYC